VVVRAIRDTLKAAPSEEKEFLSWNSPLASHIALATLTALPRVSIGQDAKWANLLITASNVCSAAASHDLDVGLAIGARALFCRAFEDENNTPRDILVRVDIILTFIREAWLTDDIELIRHVSKLRRHIATVLTSSPAWPPSGPSRLRPSARHRNVVELVTGVPNAADELRT
tara:strand:- start:2768 stop:3283 length:516 start_codon:yes stop_codon:yes gene_type:complete